MKVRFLKIALVSVIMCLSLTEIKSDNDRYKFTKVTCNSTDPGFSTFEKCRIKAVSRDANYMTIKAKMLKLPIDNLELRLQFMKKGSAWMPHLYDVTLNCDSFNHGSTLMTMMYNVLREKTNINHSCPFDHDLELPQMDSSYLDTAMAKFPLPTGEYALFTTWKVDDEIKAIVNIYVMVYKVFAVPDYDE